MPKNIKMELKRIGGKEKKEGIPNLIFETIYLFVFLKISFLMQNYKYVLIQFRFVFCKSLLHFKKLQI